MKESLGKGQRSMGYMGESLNDKTLKKKGISLARVYESKAGFRSWKFWSEIRVDRVSLSSVQAMHGKEKCTRYMAF